jgi:hypothetical protein
MADTFDAEMDALLSKADPAYFEQVIWERENGKALAHSAAQLEQTVQSRADFQLTAQSAPNTRQRVYLLKTPSGVEIGHLSCRVEGDKFVIVVTATPGGMKVLNVPPAQIPLESVSDDTIRAAMAQLVQQFDKR